MKPIVGCETATVYRGGGRRYFTKRAAYVAEARAKINSRCDCEPQEWNDYQTGYMAVPCKYHEDTDKYEKLKARLARWYAHLDTSNDLNEGSNEAEW